MADRVTPAKSSARQALHSRHPATRPPLPAIPVTALTRTQVYAQDLWARARTEDAVVGTHPYAISKDITWAAGAGRVQASGKVIGQRMDCLVVPIRAMNWRVIAVQCITADGAKQTFGPMGADGCLILGNTLDLAIPWVVVEDWADAVSIAHHHYAGNAVGIAAIMASRIPRVADAVDRQYRPDNVIMMTTGGAA